ncbi:MAG: PqqD family protein [Phycisphaerae bacterium]|nr:PqqD family protein [Phycisphaerae bacterium]
MGRRRKKDPGPSREMLLAARPLRNPNITEKEIDGGGLELTVSLPRSRLFRWLSGGRNDPIVRRYQLDAVGVETWRMIDGQTTIMTMIERLASTHGMQQRQAEAAMLAYLRTLTQRGIMMLALPHENPGEADEASRRIHG